LATDTKTYRPNRAYTVFLSLLLLTTAALLVWLGVILAPEDREAMDGIQRLVFTVVPIKPFAWLGGAVFALLGVRLAIRGGRSRPSLVVSADGFSIGGGELKPWSDMTAASTPRPEHLLLDVVRSPEESAASERVLFSQFDLGEDPMAVLAEIKAYAPLAAGS